MACEALSGGLQVKFVYIISRQVEFLDAGSPELGTLLGKLQALLREDRRCNLEELGAAVRAEVKAQPADTWPVKVHDKRRWLAPQRPCRGSEVSSFAVETSNAFSVLGDTEHDRGDIDTGAEGGARPEAGPVEAPAPAQRVQARTRRSIGTCCRPRRRSMGLQTEAEPLQSHTSEHLERPRYEGELHGERAQKGSGAEAHGHEVLLKPAIASYDAECAAYQESDGSSIHANVGDKACPTGGAEHRVRERWRAAQRHRSCICIRLLVAIPGEPADEGPRGQQLRGAARR